MPKAVLTSSAPAVALSVPAADDMATRLRAMGLSEDAVAAAVAASNKGKLVVPAPKPAVVVATPRNAPMKAVAPSAEPPMVLIVTPKEAPKKAAPIVSDVEKELDEAIPAVHHSDLDQGMEPDEEPGEPIGFARALAVAVTEQDEAPAHEDAPAAGSFQAVTLQNQWSRQSHGAMVGAFDRSDFKTPQLKLVQGSGENSTRWNQGTLVFVDEELLPPPLPDKPSIFFNFIPAAVQKYFREQLEEGSKEKPRNATTPEEVIKLGGSVEWTTDPQTGARVKPSWSPAARWTLIIEKPEGSDHPGFSIAIEINGVTRYFAACVYYANGGQYRAFSKPIIDATNFILKIGDDIVLHKRVWKMQVVKEKSGTYMVFNPRISLVNELTPPDLVSLAESLRA